jgi:cobaltochelatase CobT
MFNMIKRIGALLTPPEPKSKPEPKADGAYRVFTFDHDVEVEANQLSSVLGPLPPDRRAAHEQAWAVFSGALQGWRTEAHLIALDASARIRSRLQPAQLVDTTVTILVDQSGSMRGQSMLLAAASCDIAQDYLAHLGIRVEILGFTTVRWQGGKSRARWLRQGRPPQPGRLSDLLHIVYRRAEDTRTSTGGPDFKPMLRPDLPKENVDGEALLWAVSRLRSRPGSRKLLVVLSDGAPVDDATLMANDLGYLDRHLRAVIQAIEAAGDIRIVSIGIGFDTSRYYATPTMITTPEDLGKTLIGALEAAIIGDQGYSDSAPN